MSVKSATILGWSVIIIIEMIILGLIFLKIDQLFEADINTLSFWGIELLNCAILFLGGWLIRITIKRMRQDINDSKEIEMKN